MLCSNNLYRSKQIISLKLWPQIRRFISLCKLSTRATPWPGPYESSQICRVNHCVHNLIAKAFFADMFICFWTVKYFAIQLLKCLFCIIHVFIVCHFLIEMSTNLMKSISHCGCMHETCAFRV